MLKNEVNCDNQLNEAQLYKSDAISAAVSYSFDECTLPFLNQDDTLKYNLDDICSINLVATILHKYIEESKNNTRNDQQEYACWKTSSLLTFV